MNFSQQVRRPLVGVALSMVGGLGFQRGFGPSPLLLLALSAGVLAWICRTVPRRGAAGMYLACFFLAAAYGAVEQIHTPRQAVLPTTEISFRNQEMVGTVTEDPLISEENDTITFSFEVEAVRFGGQWRPADSVVRARISTPRSSVVYGERWRIYGWCRSREPARNGIAGFFYAKGADSHRIKQAPLSFRGACYRLRRRIVPTLHLGMANFPKQVRVLQALLLGYRNALPYDLYQTFARTGTFHIFAISGLHVGVMAAILIAVLKMLGAPKPRWGLFLIPMLLIYVVSTGMKPSAFRAFTMAAVYFSAPLFGRRPDTASAIALAAVVLLLINPLQLGDPGFLLSFTVVSGIVMVHAFVTHRFSGFRRPGWAVPLAQLNGPRPVMVLLRTVGLLALTSAAAWVFSAPLTARFFNTFSPVALIGNLAIIPLTFVIVLTGCLSLLTAPLFIPAAITFNHANRLFVSLLISIIQRLGALPGAYRFVRAPSFAMLALWYGGLVCIFTGPQRWRRVGLLMAACSGVLWFSASSGPPSGIEVTQRGDSCAILQVEARRILLAEGTSYSMSSVARQLRERGMNCAQTLALSGPQIDADAVRELCAAFSIRQVCLPPSLEGGAEAVALLRNGLSVSFSARPRWNAGDGFLAVDWDRGKTIPGRPEKPTKSQADPPSI